MRVGEVEYTRKVSHLQTGAGDLEVEGVNWISGLTTFPLLVRTTTTMEVSSAVTADSAVFLENGNNVAAGLTMSQMFQDQRVFTLAYERRTLVTSGFPNTQFPWELTWWKLMVPETQLFFQLDAINGDAEVLLHYRFAELTNDEVIEFAAQRAQQ